MEEFAIALRQVLSNDWRGLPALIEAALAAPGCAAPNWLPQFAEVFGYGKAYLPLEQTSYGEKRRLEIAMALAQNPRVLLLDEPLAGLSSEERETITSLLGLIDRDITVIMIEHDMEIALAFADRITLLHYGEVITAGSRREVVDDPRTREIYLGH